jgi:starvation-inducible DNA-binding protein
MQPYMKKPHNQKIAEALGGVLADTFVLYFRAHAFHWNVEGRDFLEFHEFFGEQYEDLWKVTDDLAERIRALDVYAPVNLAAILKTASLKEEKSLPDARGMLTSLLQGHESLIDSLHACVEIAQKGGDEGTADLCIGRIQEHEKTAWMIRSFLKGSK